ncbi:MAG: FAD-dependent oxidoreductase [Blautia marasmi]
MARAKYRVIVLEKAEIGGQITITSEIVNYPGVEKISGKELTGNMRRQAENFGAEFAAAQVLDMELAKDIKVLHTTKGEYKALGVILATGANPRKLGFKGEREFQGRGVAYCATCDGEFFSGLDVFVIGGGFAAVEEGIFLTKYAKKVTLVVRKKEFSCAGTVSDQLKNFGNIEVLFETELLEVGAGIWSLMPDSETTEHKKSGSTRQGRIPDSVFLYLPDMYPIRTGSVRRWKRMPMDICLQTTARRPIWTVFTQRGMCV